MKSTQWMAAVLMVFSAMTYGCTIGTTLHSRWLALSVHVSSL